MKRKQALSALLAGLMAMSSVSAMAADEIIVMDDIPVQEESAETDGFFSSEDIIIGDDFSELSQPGESVITEQTPELTEQTPEIETETEPEIQVDMMAEQASDIVANGVCGKHLKWKLSDKGVLTISGPGKMYDYSDENTAPWNSRRESIAQIRVDDSVTAIGDYAFYKCGNVKSVRLPSEIGSIGEFAFAECGKLESVTVPNGVQSIERYTFSGCRSLKSVTLPNGIKTIGSFAFDSCSELDTVLLPKTVTNIDECAFYNSGLCRITIPDGVTMLKWRSFRGCSCLTSVVIPKSVKEISAGVFAECYVKDVYYLGSQSEWAKVIGREALSSAKMHFDSTMDRFFVDCEFSLKYKSTTYSGKAKKPTVTVKDGSRELKKNTDFTVSYSNNVEIGTATATITGKGQYTGTITRSFNIIPKTTELTKVTAGTKSFTAKWKKQTEQTTGYQVQYAKGERFTKPTSKRISGKNNTSKKIENLEAGRTYYVRVRTYKKVGDKRFYSNWSDIMTVRTK